MQSNTKQIDKGLLYHIKANRHLLMGYLFLGLVFFGAVSSVYYWENKERNMAVIPNPARQVESGEQVRTNGEPCDPKITLARDPNTSETREFSSPCYILPPWEVVVK